MPLILIQIWCGKGIFRVIRRYLLRWDALTNVHCILNFYNSLAYQLDLFIFFKWVTVILTFNVIICCNLVVVWMKRCNRYSPSLKNRSYLNKRFFVQILFGSIFHISGRKENTIRAITLQIGMITFNYYRIRLI